MKRFYEFIDDIKVSHSSYNDEVEIYIPIELINSRHYDNYEKIIDNFRLLCIGKKKYTTKFKIYRK